MATINPQITSATAGDRRRAAQFNKTKGPLGPQDSALSLLGRASHNLGRACLQLASSPLRLEPAQVRRDLHDARNLIALALSRLPGEE